MAGPQGLEADSRKLLGNFKNAAVQRQASFSLTPLIRVVAGLYVEAAALVKELSFAACQPCSIITFRKGCTAIKRLLRLPLQSFTIRSTTDMLALAFDQNTGYIPGVPCKVSPKICTAQYGSIAQNANRKGIEKAVNWTF